MIGIYKIENLINHKIYIGQSVNIERRWGEHCRSGNKSLIGKAIKKYGKQNFSFVILEECNMDSLDEKEEYYIKYFNSITPNGYNIMERNNGSHINYFIDKETLNEIISKIKDKNLLFSKIAEEYDISIKTITRINQGYTYHQNNIDYPIRKQIILPEAHCIDCGKLISKGAIRCKQCADLVQRKVDRPSKEELYNFLIKNKGNFVAAGRQYGVCDNAIRKWCKQYKLPFHSKDYK